MFWFYTQILSNFCSDQSSVVQRAVKCIYLTGGLRQLSFVVGSLWQQTVLPQFSCDCCVSARQKEVGATVAVARRPHKNCLRFRVTLRNEKQNDGTCTAPKMICCSTLFFLVAWKCFWTIHIFACSAVMLLLVFCVSSDCMTINSYIRIFVEEARSKAKRH